MPHPKLDQPLSEISTSTLRKERQAFLVDRQAGGCSPRTVKGYGEELTRLCSWLEGRGVRDILSITPTHPRAV